MLHYKQTKRSKILAKEALDWIHSLDLPTVQNDLTKFGYFDDSNDHVADHMINEYKTKILRRGLSLWIAKYNRRIRQRAAVRSVDSKRILAVKLRCAMKKLSWHKMKLSLLYWLLKSKLRRQRKATALHVWKARCGGHALMLKFMKLHNKLARRVGFLRWKRRSKWPLVRTKRERWLCAGAISTLKDHTTLSRTQHHLVAVGSRCFLHKHWPTLQWHTKTHKRLTQRLAMGASVWSMQRVTQALQTLAARARLQRKIHRAAMVAAQRTRSRLIHESILLWHHHAEGAWQQGSRAERADRQWKRHCFHQFRRGVQHLASAAASSSIIAVLENRASTFRNISNNFQPVLSTELHSSRSNNSSPAKTSKSRWVVFRGRLFRRRRALVRLWKHAVRVALQQRGAVAWGVKWWKRKVFRTLQMLCRKHRNLTLNNCYGSLCCKGRLLRQSMRCWQQRAVLKRSTRHLALYCLRRKFLRRWCRWHLHVDASQLKMRRAGLRDGLNRLTRALRHWHATARRDRQCRYRLTVFRKLHPVPEVSFIRSVFDAWRYEFTRYRREHKRRFRAVVEVRRRYCKRRGFQNWSDRFEQSQVRRVQLRRGMGALYQKHLHCKSRIYALSNALLLYKIEHGTTTAAHPHVKKSLHSLPSFLLSRGLMVHTSQQLRRLYALCQLRRWFALLKSYCTHCTLQSKHFREAHERVIRQCTERFAAYYHVANKHAKWALWRRLRAWYQLQQRRLTSVYALSTRIEGKQYFRRWVDLYRRRAIDRTLQIPSAPMLIQPHSRVVHTSTPSATDPDQSHDQFYQYSSWSRGAAPLSSAVNISYSRDYSTLLSHGSVNERGEYDEEEEDVHPSMALDASVQVLKHHPAYIRQLEKSRLKALSLSTIHCGSANTSAVGSVFSSTNVSPAPAAGKILSQSVATATTTRQRGNAKQSFLSGGGSSSSAGSEGHARTQSRPVALKKINVANKIWGQLIEEDCIDAARRSYTGQYLLSRNKLPIA